MTPAQHLREAWEEVPAVVCHGFCLSPRTVKAVTSACGYLGVGSLSVHSPEFSPYYRVWGCLLTFSIPLLHLFDPVSNF